MFILGCHQVDSKGNQMAGQKRFLRFLTRVVKKNKSGTSFTTEYFETIRAQALEGETLYISNGPPADPQSEIELIAQEVQEMLLLKIEQEEYITVDEMVFVIEYMRCIIEEVRRDAA